MALKNIKIFREIIQNKNTFQCNKIAGLQDNKAFSTRLPARSLYNDEIKPNMGFPLKQGECEGGNRNQMEKSPGSLRKLIVKENIKLANTLSLEPTQAILAETSPILQRLQVRNYTHYSNKELQEKSLKYGKDCLGKKKKRCAIPQKEKRKCKQEANCPKFLLKDCPHGKEPPDCAKIFRETDCSKVPAPYPSYSESCVEYMPEDPSECHQCPWRRCENANTIRVQKNKRRFHTMTSRTAGGGTANLDMPLIPEWFNGMNCDATKKPCERPPGVCEERKKLEEESKKKRKAKNKDKKALNVCHWANSLGILVKKPLELDTINPYTLMASCQSGNMELTKKKHPDCGHNINMVPEDRSMNVILAKGDKKKKPKGDEGHPPPCPVEESVSLDCPEKPIKKPKYRHRPIKDSFYKRPEDPYTRH